MFDRPICCLIYRLIQLCISAYIILLICKGKLYLKTDPPIPGAVRLTLREPNNFTKPSYCVESSPSTNPSSCAEDKLPCVYWGAKEIQYPIEETGVAFFTTRASVIKYPQGTCNILASSPEDACIINNNNHYLGKHVMNSSFIADIENYTRVASLLMDLSMRNGVNIKQSCKNIYTWFKGIFGFNGDNDNEESVPLIRTEIF
ncbi:hypothetical protein RclHR1_13120005 [Rhizophagus clarus]|uniref:Uncharacterized protein n=1 Tax=Rhizophagus clarus TaxID=94130 RepID=A0A2Z6QPC6_9GLOM|nr:hypothetical protein RclHR1_13120005 [Rhizophagus clarus]